MSEPSYKYEIKLIGTKDAKITGDHPLVCFTEELKEHTSKSLIMVGKHELEIEIKIKKGEKIE